MFFRAAFLLLAYSLAYPWVVCAVTPSAAPKKISYSSIVPEEIPPPAQSAAEGSLSLYGRRALQVDGSFALATLLTTRFNLGPKYFVGAEIGFTHFFTHPEDPSQTMTYEDPYLSLGDRDVLQGTWKAGRLGLSLNVIFPGSQASQKASLRAAYSVRGILDSKLSVFTFSARSEFFVFDYRNQYADVAGSVSNSKYGFEERFTLGYPIPEAPGLKPYAQAGIAFYRNYVDSTVTQYRLVVGTEWRLSRHWTLDAYLASRDLWQSYNDIFAAENSSGYFGVIYVF